MGDGDLQSVGKIVTLLFEDMLRSLSHMPTLTSVFKDKLTEKRNTFQKDSES